MKQSLTIHSLLFFALVLAGKMCMSQNVADRQEAYADNLLASNDEVYAPVNQDTKHDFGPVFHIVTNDETISSIIQRYGISMSDFRGWNYLPNGIKPGMKVVVNFNWAKENTGNKETSPEYHRVAFGETLYHISQVYHVSIEQLKDWNNLTSNIVVLGKELIVSK